jgi:hypothetical protein
MSTTYNSHNKSQSVAHTRSEQTLQDVDVVCTFGRRGRPAPADPRAQLGNTALYN